MCHDGPNGLAGPLPLASSSTSMPPDRFYIAWHVSPRRPPSPPLIIRDAAHATRREPRPCAIPPFCSSSTLR